MGFPVQDPHLHRPRVGKTEGHKCPIGAGYAPGMFGLLARAKAVKQRTLSLAQLNLELAKLEGKQKATEIGIGAGLGAVAGVLVVYGIGFAFAAAAAGLSEAISLWLSLLIVAGILFGLAAIAGFLAMRFIKKLRRRRRRKRSKRPPGRSRRLKAMSEKPGVEEIRRKSPPSGSASTRISTR